MSSTVHFSIKYDGPALAAHQMDVRELAPALIALSDLLEQSNKTAYPDATAVRVNIQGNFKGGSFGVDLTAVQSITDQIVTMLTGPSASALSNLSGILSGLGLIGGGGCGLIGLIKWLNGRKPTSIKQIGDAEVFEIRSSEAIETMQVDLVAGKLYRSRAVRQSLLKVLKPLETDGIDYFASGQGGEAQNVVTKDQLGAFESIAQGDEALSDNLLTRIIVQVESPVFKDGNKWRLNDGESAFFCTIDDQDFLSRIESGQERFGKGDVLLADLRRFQIVNDGVLRVEWSLVKVHEHREPLQRGLI